MSIDNIILTVVLCSSKVNTQWSILFLQKKTHRKSQSFGRNVFDPKALCLQTDFIYTVLNTSTLDSVQKSEPNNHTLPKQLLNLNYDVRFMM